LVAAAGYCTFCTLLTFFIAFTVFVAFVTRVAAGFLPELALACRAFGVTFFVAI
jgi:hypothetical protein